MKISGRILYPVVEERMKAEWNYSNLDVEEDIPDEVEEEVVPEPTSPIMEDILKSKKK